MRVDLIVLIITGFLVFNAYHEGKYSKLFSINKKYIQMGTYAILGITLYLFIKRNPNASQNMFKHANDIIRYMPIDRDTADMITPFFDLTNARDKINEFATVSQPTASEMISPQMKRMLNSGKNTTKRCVSETKKKYVAAQQNWKCGRCFNQLKATFEVDHKIELQDGGSNHVTNLEALCRECHAEKTMQKHMKN